MSRKKKALGDDPLFVNPEEELDNGFDSLEDGKDFSDIVTTDKLEEVKKTISEMKHEVKMLERRKRNREDNYQRMTFIVRRDLLERLRDYCYTERISQKEGLEEALVSFFADKDSKNLVKKPKRGKE